MESSELSSRIRGAKATERQAKHSADKVASDAEALKRRELAEAKQVEQILAELVSKLNSPNYKPGEKMRVMVIYQDPMDLSLPRPSVIAHEVFQQLSEAEQLGSGWYPVKDNDIISFEDLRLDVIDLVYGTRPQEDISYAD